MRALVTGAAGFVGRYMVEEMKARGYDVTTVDVATRDPHQGWLDFHDFVKEEPRAEFDLVAHCAYLVGGRATIDGVPEVLAKNVALDAALFNWADPRRIGNVLYFSSSAAYPTYMQRAHLALQRLHEDDTEPQVFPDTSRKPAFFGVPDGRYGWAKLNGEMLAESYRDRGGRVSVVRPFSGYAWDQDAGYPFPDLVTRCNDVLADGKDEIEVWGDPQSTRDWIHIYDVVRGSLAVANTQRRLPPHAPAARWPVNACTGRGTRFGDLVSMIMTRLDPTSIGTAIVPRLDKPMGCFHRVGNPHRFRTYHVPQITLEEGIDEACRRL